MEILIFAIEPQYLYMFSLNAKHNSSLFIKKEYICYNNHNLILGALKLLKIA